MGPTKSWRALAKVRSEVEMRWMSRWRLGCDEWGGGPDAVEVVLRLGL